MECYIIIFFCCIIITGWVVFCSVQFSTLVVSDSLQPHRLQHASFPCSSQTPGAYSDLCPLNGWCHPTISSSVILLLSSILPSVRVFSNELVLCIMAKALALQLQHQSFKRIFKSDFFRIDWFDLLAVQGTLKSFLQHHSSVTCSNCHLLISFSPFNFVWNFSVLFFFLF